MANGYRAASGGLEHDLISGLEFYDWIGVLVYAVAASVIAAFDYPDRSIQIYLNRGVPRAALLAARMVTILFFGLLMVGFTVAALLGLGALSRGLFFGQVEASSLNLAALLPVSLRVFWSAVPYLAMTVLFATLSRSPLFAAGGTILYGCILESLALRLPDPYRAVVPYLPISLSRVLQIANAALNRGTGLPAPSASAMPELQAVLWIGAIFAVTCGLAYSVFSRQDLGG